MVWHNEVLVFVHFPTMSALFFFFFFFGLEISTKLLNSLVDNVSFVCVQKSFEEAMESIKKAKAQRDEA